MDFRKKNTGIQAAIASAVFLGFAPIFGKAAILDGFSPLCVAAFRTGLAALLLLIPMLIFKRQYFYIYPVGVIGCALAGIINGVGSIFYYTAISRLDASVAQLLYSFYPLFVAFWLLMDRQPIRWLTIVRLLLSLPGVFLLLSAGASKIDILGAVMMLIAAGMYALHLIINQRILYEVPAPTVTLYTLLAMSATVILAYLIFDRSMPPATASWWPVIIMGLITFMSRITLFAGVKQLGSLQTALLGLGEIIVTVVIAIIWFGDSLTWLQWLGAILLLASMVLVGFDKPTPVKRYQTGLLAWLNPPKINPSDFGQSQ